MAKFNLFLVLALLPVLFSCASVEHKEPIEEIEQIDHIKHIEQEVEEEEEQEQAASVPEPQTLGYSTKIMGKGRVSADKLADFLLRNNPQADPEFVRVLMMIYIEEASYEGVDHDIAFAQMCLETGFLAFGGLVQPEWNNFCGLGAIGPQQPGLIFPDPRTGVRAHIQHLKAYGSEEPLNLELVNARFLFVRRGSSPTIEGLTGTWAVDRAYSEKINSILERLFEFSF